MLLLRAQAVEQEASGEHGYGVVLMLQGYGCEDALGISEATREVVETTRMVEEGGALRCLGHEVEVDRVGFERPLAGVDCADAPMSAVASTVFSQQNTALKAASSRNRLSLRPLSRR